MIQNVVTQLGESPLFGAISVCLFFAVFTGAMIYAMTRNKSVCQAASALPLNDGERTTKGVAHEE